MLRRRKREATKTTLVQPVHERNCGRRGTYICCGLHTCFFFSSDSDLRGFDQKRAEAARVGGCDDAMCLIFFLPFVCRQLFLPLRSPPTKVTLDATPSHTHCGCCMYHPGLAKESRGNQDATNKRRKRPGYVHFLVTRSLEVPTGQVEPRNHRHPVLSFRVLFSLPALPLTSCVLGNWDIHSRGAQARSSLLQATHASDKKHARLAFKRLTADLLAACLRLLQLS